MHILQEANITRNLYKDAKGITQMQKPDKIYLENTNLLYAFSPKQVNTGNLRETFFINQLSYNHLVEYAPKGDFSLIILIPSRWRVKQKQINR